MKPHEADLEKNHDTPAERTKFQQAFFVLMRFVSRIQ
jgi:hypothetical protein